MGVAGGGLHLGVPQEFANHGQAFAYQKTAAGETVSQIVYTEIVQSSTCPDAPPGVLKVGQMTALLAAGDDPRVLFGAWVARRSAR